MFCLSVLMRASCRHTSHPELSCDILSEIRLKDIPRKLVSEGGNEVSIARRCVATLRRFGTKDVDY